MKNKNKTYTKQIKNLSNDELLAEFIRVRNLRDFAVAELKVSFNRASSDRRCSINMDWNKAVIERNAQLNVLRNEGHARKAGGRYIKTTAEVAA